MNSFIPHTTNPQRTNYTAPFVRRTKTLLILSNSMGATSMVRGGVTRYLPAGFPRHESVSSDETRFGDVELEFLDDIAEMSSTLANSDASIDDEFHPNEMELLDEDDDDAGGENRDSNNGDADENRSFWENQHQLLQANLYRTTSVESRIRNAAKEAIEEMRSRSTEMVCSCSRQVAASSCRNCLRTQVSRRLQNAGYNSAICKTKWKSSLHIPSGEHTFVDVIDNSASKKKDVRVIIEVNFRAEFEMAKGSEEYNLLVGKLPEVFVGKAERLSNVIKVLCMAAKRCMKENKMHMGPWRKHRYVQAKWLGPCERNTSSSSLSMGYSSSDQRSMMPRQKQKASMLTVDLMLDKLPNMHYTAAVEVV